jgi:hypothetical protein
MKQRREIAPALITYTFCGTVLMMLYGRLLKRASVRPGSV